MKLVDIKDSGSTEEVRYLAEVAINFQDILNKIIVKLQSTDLVLKECAKGLIASKIYFDCLMETQATNTDEERIKITDKYQKLMEEQYLKFDLGGEG